MLEQKGPELQNLLVDSVGILQNKWRRKLSVGDETRENF